MLDTMMRISLTLAAQRTPDIVMPEGMGRSDFRYVLILILTILSVLIFSAVIVSRLAAMYADEVITLGHLVTGVVAILCVAVYIFTRIGTLDSVVVGLGAVILFMLYVYMVESRESEKTGRPSAKRIPLKIASERKGGEAQKREADETALQHWEEEMQLEEYYARCPYCGQDVLIRKGKCLNCGQQVPESGKV